MSIIAITATSLGTDRHSDEAGFKTVLLFSCLGLLASFGLAAAGVDLGLI